MKTEASMSEFKFSCPQCKGVIQCDTSYVGSRIDCPICQKSIIVPPVPPTSTSVAERRIQLKKSTLKKAGIIAACALVVVAVVMIVPYLFGPKSVTFKAFVDGTDVVKLSGRHLWVEHLEWQQPTRMSINGVNWRPTWNETKSGAFPDWSDNKSTRYALKRAFSPGNPQNIKLTKRQGRGAVAIIEMPSRQNDQTLAIQMDDGPQGGAAWYEFTVTW
jgi:hypothetical protein